MRIHLIDYGGYPFTLQLAAELGGRGHLVRYVCRDVSRLRERIPSPGVDPVGSLPLEMSPVDPATPLEKRDLARRWSQERGFGRQVGRMLRADAPHVVLAANVPLEALVSIQRAARSLDIPFVFWLQDLLGVAMRDILSRKLGPVGRAIGARYERLEGDLLKRSSDIIAISEHFRALLVDRGLAEDRIHVEPNWAPLDEIRVAPKDNAWSRDHAFADVPVVMYSGSLGMKHNPALLLALAEDLQETGGGHVVVVAEGAGADWLEAEATARGIGHLHVLPFQDGSRFSDVLGSADVLVALLEPEAGSYSVPSKVLSYVCAGRPVLAAVPKDNDVARLLESTGAGVVCSPTNPRRFARMAQDLLGRPPERREMGSRGRAFAERAFDIVGIADRVESVLEGAATRTPSP